MKITLEIENSDNIELLSDWIISKDGLIGFKSTNLSPGFFETLSKINTSVVFKNKLDTKP